MHKMRNWLTENYQFSGKELETPELYSIKLWRPSKGGISYHLYRVRLQKENNYLAAGLEVAVDTSTPELDR